jgi:tripartite-type tricarboxylate transporter receptor subunit TctC
MSGILILPFATRIRSAGARPFSRAAFITARQRSTASVGLRSRDALIRSRLLRFASVLCASLVAAVSSPVIAQGFPSKPVRILVGFPAGTSVDILGRVIAQKLNEAWQQPVIIDNRPGAAGNLAADAVAKSPGDGYTLLLANNGLAVSAALYRKLPFSPIDDLAPIVRVASAPLVLVVAPALPVKSLRELIALARSRPGQLNFASSGTGNSDHMAGELFKSMAHVDIVHVPYKGSPQALTGIIGGETAMYLTGLPPTLPLIKAGRLRALGVSGTSRSAVLPGVPTITEAGLPGYQASLWYGTFAPGRTTREVIEKLNVEIDRVLKLTDVRERFAGLGVEPAGGTVADFSVFFRSDIATWSRVAKTAGLTLE